VVVLTLISGCIPVALLTITRPTVDAIASLVAGSGESLNRALMLVAAAATLLLLSEAMSALLSWLRIGHGERVSAHVRGVVQDQSSRVAMAFYEQPEYFDQLYRARDAASERPVELVSSFAEIGRSVIALSGVLIVLSGYEWWLPAVLAIAMLPALGSAMMYALRQHRLALSMTIDDRYAWYYDWILTDRSSAAEIRAFALAGHFRRLYQDVRRKIREALLKLHGREAVVQVALSIVGLAAAGGAVSWMLLRATRGEATLGDVALCFQAFAQGTGLTRGAVSSLAASYRNALFLDDFFRFLSLPADPAEAARAAPAANAESRSSRAPEEPPVIRFEGVHFSYPGGRRPALDGLDLQIEPRSIVAILGANGAGKSTLVKLLCRFYEPSKGRICLDGRDAREWQANDLRRFISVLFQDSLRLSGSVAENVLPLASHEIDAMKSAVRAAGAEELVADLPSGLDTPLAAWFPGGTDLSGGEWQRIAIARAFARSAPVLVLDEPTSAMDPWAEREWLSALRSHAADRTVILITHRLTTAMAADAIHVMEAGRVVESGTHEQLMQTAGAYSRLWGAPETSVPSKADQTPETGRSTPSMSLPDNPLACNPTETSS